MRGIRYALLGVFAVALFCLPAPQARAQIGFGINIGAAPACPYGYYDYSPYRCAPYGYYGPQWFNSGVFVGAGPWFHGRRGFYGPVNHDFDPRYGYHGRLPDHGHWREPDDHFHGFHGNAWRDGHGHERGGDDHHPR